MKRYAKLLDCEGRCRYLLPSPTLLAGRRLRWHAAASPPDAFCYPVKNERPWRTGSVQPAVPPAWHAGGRFSSSWPRATPSRPWRARWASNGRWCVSGPSAFSPSVWTGSPTPLAAGPRAIFPPEVALHVVRLACERPELLGRSLSQWDCTELARQLIAAGMVEETAAATGRRLRAAHPLKPWRPHVWLYPKQPRDIAFYATVSERIDLYTRPRRPDALVLSGDEKTSRPPRPRRAPTLPAQPQHIPNRHEHEYKRAGALKLFAAFDTRSGKV
jgi:hypothetical protein